MKKIFSLLAFSILLLMTITSCDHNVYLPEYKPEPPKVWEVQEKQFYKFSDALNYYMETLGTKDIDKDNIITLLRDVPASERGEAIIIPDSFPEDGVVRVDFNNHEYWFEDNLDYFFEIRQGDTIEIINGTTVIDVPANPNPKALVVNTKTVTIDDHLIDDRRPVPKAIDIQENGILKVLSSSSSTKNALIGEVSVAGGGQLTVDSGFIEATSFDVSVNESSEEGKVYLTSGYIFISDTMNVNTNGKVYVSGGIISANTINVESTDDEQKAEFHLTGGDLNAENLDAGNNSVINISQPDSENPTQAFIENTSIASDASFTISDGDVTFRSSIEKETEGTFEISGGTIHNPHVLTPYVEQAIIEGGGTETTTNVVIHEPLEAHAKKDPTCTEEGYEAYWICIYDGCGRWFNDKNCTEENTSKTPVVIPALGHDLSHHDHKDPTCTEEGNIEYWHCSRCDEYFSDEGITEITKEQTIIYALGHLLTHHDAVEPTCTDAGNIEYWHCSRCNEYFSDEGITEISKEQTILPALGHLLTHHDAVEPTCTEDGIIEYWHCSQCLKYFTDEACTHETTESETVIPALGHDWEDSWTTDATYHWHKCKRDSSHKKDIAEHVFEFYYSFENGILNISHECNVCHRGATTPHYHEEGVFHLTYVDGMTVTVDKSTGNVTVAMTRTGINYSYLKWYDINGKEITDLGHSRTSFTFNSEGRFGFRCDKFDSTGHRVDSCYTQFTKYND